MAYRVYLEFNPEEVNRGRRSGCGTWRVGKSVRIEFPQLRPVLVVADVLVLASNRPYRKGVLVNPKRVAIDFVRGCHAGI